ncbi:hypothetical protein BV25DRAFT_433071 [Artomyces pyxidatus]|uniref:Uncharacterized protein n=1 Tax=Artomyces pyxidatus TaxID=48021 RepID=A0ACB8T4S5_9AGAM|nr:hypothetical protein BV25DRAFT_433071 [Artomyces pyxidatus]
MARRWAIALDGRMHCQTASAEGPASALVGSGGLLSWKRGSFSTDIPHYAACAVRGCTVGKAFLAIVPPRHVGDGCAGKWDCHGTLTGCGLRDQQPPGRRHDSSAGFGWSASRCGIAKTGICAPSVKCGHRTWKPEVKRTRAVLAGQRVFRGQTVKRWTVTLLPRQERVGMNGSAASGHRFRKRDGAGWVRLVQANWIWKPGIRFYEDSWCRLDGC